MRVGLATTFAILVGVGCCGRSAVPVIGLVQKDDPARGRLEGECPPEEMAYVLENKGVAVCSDKAYVHFMMCTRQLGLASESAEEGSSKSGALGIGIGPITVTPSGSTSSSAGYNYLFAAAGQMEAARADALRECVSAFKEERRHSIPPKDLILAAIHRHQDSSWHWNWVDGHWKTSVKLQVEPGGTVSFMAWTFLCDPPDGGERECPTVGEDQIIATWSATGGTINEEGTIHFQNGRIDKGPKWVDGPKPTTNGLEFWLRLGDFVYGEWCRDGLCHIRMYPDDPDKR